MGLYNHIKLLEHRQTLDTILAGKGTDCPPLHVRIEPSEVCNFRCRFCIWHDPERHRAIDNQVDMTGKRQLPRDRLLQLIDELADCGTQAVSFTGAGDPMVYPYMAEVLRRIRERGMKAGVTSNLAMPIKDETIDELARCQWLRWSMNGGTEQVYLTVNRPRGNSKDGSFARAKSNVRRILGCMMDRSRLNASFVVHDTNENDTYAAAELAADLGVSSIAFRPDTPFDREETSLDYKETVLRQIMLAKQELDSSDFSVYINEDRLEDVKKLGDPELLCFYANHSTYVAANGDVYPCCYTRYDRYYVMGNILDREFREFWSSPERRNFYQRLAYDQCPSCPHGRTNQVLQSLYQGHAETAMPTDTQTGKPDPFV